MEPGAEMAARLPVKRLFHDRPTAGRFSPVETDLGVCPSQNGFVFDFPQ